MLEFQSQDKMRPGITPPQYYRHSAEMAGHAYHSVSELASATKVAALLRQLAPQHMTGTAVSSASAELVARHVLRRL